MEDTFEVKVSLDTLKQKNRKYLVNLKEALKLQILAGIPTIPEFVEIIDLNGNVHILRMENVMEIEITERKL